MILNYYKSQGSKPLEIDTESSNHTVYLRKNIVPIDEDSGLYEYDECKLTREQYDEYQKELKNDIIAQQQAQIDELKQCILDMSEVIYS